MLSKSYRYILLLAILIGLTACASKYSFNTDNTDPSDVVTIEVDNRIEFKSIDNQKVDYKVDNKDKASYFVSLKSGRHILTILFSAQYKNGKTVNGHKINFPVELIPGKNYKLIAQDHFDRLKIPGNTESEELRSLVHFFLKAQGVKTQKFKSLCNLESISYENLKCLVKNNENLNRRYGNNRDLALIHFTVLKDMRKSLLLLLDNGADINRRSRAKGFTPLHYAVTQNNLPVVKLLIKKGADLNSIDHIKATPLHYAAKSGYYDIVIYLKKSGADPDKFDNKGHKPVDWANKADQKKVASILTKKSTKKTLLKKYTVKKSSKKVKKKKVVKKVPKKRITPKRKQKVKRKKIRVASIKKRYKKRRKSKRSKRRKKKRLKKPDEEDTLKPRLNPIPDILCSTQVCYASLSDSIEKGISKTKYSKLELKDLRKVAYIYFQISKLLKRTTPDAARNEFNNASKLFKKMKFDKKKQWKNRARIISDANKHVIKAAHFIVEDADKRLKVLEK